jgi:DNA adenine methylase
MLARVWEKPRRPLQDQWEFALTLAPVAIAAAHKTAVAELPRIRRSRNGRAVPRPFLKWVGGKTQLLPHIEDLVPKGIQRYFEPFVGGGAVFFHLEPGAALLSDVNDELVDCWTAVRDHLADVMDCLQQHVYEKDHYYEVRQQNRHELSLPARAARTIFLNKTGFNGLYRVNSKGLFNVPFGRYANPNICDELNLPACSDRLQGVDIEQRDFGASLAEAGEGDFAYVDPPYVPVSDSASFTSYTKDGFGPDEQQRLADELVSLHRRGARFALSNADVPATHELYADLLSEPGVKVRHVRARRSVNSKAGRRGSVGEVIVHNA